MMKRRIISILIVSLLAALPLFSTATAPTLLDNDILALVWEFTPSDYYTYKFGFYDKSVDTYTAVDSKTLTEYQDLAGESITAYASVLVGWSVESPEERLYLKMSASGELYGEAKVAEYIPWAIEITPNTEVTMVGSELVNEGRGITIGSKTSGGAYGKQTFATLTPKANGNIASGYANVTMTTGNAYGKAIQEYTGYLTLYLEAN